MPLQARDNSWTCEYCGTAGFQFLDDVRNHEQDCIQSARKRPRTESPNDAQAGMAPLDATGGEYDSSRPKSPRFTVMASGDNNRYQLDRADALACQNIEVFEAGPEFEEESRTGPVAVGQVGIRCVHCAEQPTDGYSMYFPGSVDALGQGIQMVADRHVSQCPAVPEQLRLDYQQAYEQRNRDREKSRSATDEERSLMALNTYCTMFCRNCNIVDKFPPQSGLAFYHREQQPYAPTPHHSRGGDASYLSSSGHRPPIFQSMMAQMGDDIAPTPLARSSTEAPPNYEQGYSRYPAPYPSGQRGMYQEGMGAQTPHVRSSVAFDGPASQQQGPPQDSPFSGYAMYPYDMPPSIQTEFPFFQDSNSSWSCKFCSSVPPHYRDRMATWKSSDPPPTQFIDQHLSSCRSYHQVNMPTALRPPPSHQEIQYVPRRGFQGPPSPSYGSHSASRDPVAPSQPMPYHSSGPPGHDPNFGFPPPAEPNDPRPSEMSPSSDGPGESTYPHAPARGQPMAPMVSRPLPVGDSTAQQAIYYLAAAQNDMSRSHPSMASADQLVLDEDRILLTDYFFYLFKQLRVCRFAEGDRKTRGGKRDNIAIGYGGMQCIHCSEASNARKFFWSNVDRLANSFAEIPAHVLKCRRCPNQTKTAIMELKTKHAEQMATLPRGSQKVFFRRMWRRLHDADPVPHDESSESKESEGGPVADSPPPPPPAPQQQRNAEGQSSPSAGHAEASASSPDGTSTDESAHFLERPTDEAAKALAASLTQSNPPSPSSRVLLGIPEDKEWLSDMDCFIRRNLEVFCATAEDVDFAHQDRKYPITVGQVGIRCIHCALAGGGAACRGNAIAFPYSINGIYEAVREFQRLHLESCDNLPAATRQKLEEVKGSSSLSSVLRKYYVLAANALGMYDTPDGIRSGGESVPVRSSAAFTFTDDLSEVMRKDQGAVPPTEYIETGPARRKRKQSGDKSSDDAAVVDTKPAATSKNDDPK